jgi:DNA-directed RNA polymerase specialized sigma subunit
LLPVAVVAAFQAAKTFDHRHSFATHIRERIRGALLDYVRERDQTDGAAAQRLWPGLR